MMDFGQIGQISFMTQEMKLIRKKTFPYKDMIGKWNDILIHGNLQKQKKEDGFFKIWVNNKLKYEYNGIYNG